MRMLPRTSFRQTNTLSARSQHVSARLLTMRYLNYITGRNTASETLAYVSQFLSLGLNTPNH